jgi:hypothetical protein
MSHWLALKSTKELLEGMAGGDGITSSPVMWEYDGKSGHSEWQGTYIHQDLVPDLAGWAYPPYRRKALRLLKMHAVREFEERMRPLIQVKDERIDSLEHTMRALLDATSQTKVQNSDLNDSLSEARDQITETHEQLHATQLIAEATARKLGVAVDTRVILPEEEGKKVAFVMLRLGVVAPAVHYLAARRQFATIEEKIRDASRDHPNTACIYPANANSPKVMSPNAKIQWNRMKPYLKEQRYVTFLPGNAFEFTLNAGYTEEQLVDDCTRIAEERLHVDDPTPPVPPTP